MFCSFFLKESPQESALEGIVFKEGKGTFIKHFWKKRLLSYDEVAKCLRYYTPQRVLKGTIYLSDILFITPGRSQGKDARKDNVFEITVPGRVYVFHVNNRRETRKWIGIISRELDSLKIRDRIQLSNGNFNEGTYFKTLRPNSVLLNSLKIGDHREHEECCFLFDEEHQHKIIALESLCSLQAMKIYELSHEVQLAQQKISVSETPPSAEVLSLREENRKLRFSFTREQIRVLDLRAKIEEAEFDKAKEQNSQFVKVKHQHVDVQEHIKQGIVVKPSTPKKQPSQASKPNISNTSFVNLPSLTGSLNNSKVDEIRKLTEELRQTKDLLAIERAKVHEFSQRQHSIFSPIISNSPSPSPLVFESHSSITTPTPMSSSPSSLGAAPNRSPSMAPRPSKLHAIQESESSALNLKSNSPSYSTFNAPPPSREITNSYINHMSNSLAPRDPIHQLSTHPPSPQPTRPPPNASPQAVQRRVEPLTNPPQPSKLPHTPLQANAFAPHDVKLAASTSSVAPTTSSDALSSSDTSSVATSSDVEVKKTDFNLRESVSSINNGPTSDTASTNGKTSSDALSMTSSIEIAQAFNIAPNGIPQIVTNKPRSLSTSTMSVPIKPVALRPNGVVEETTSVPDAHFRSRTNSNPPPYKHSQSANALSSTPPKTPIDTIYVSKFGNEIAEMLSSRFPDDNGVAMQFISKLNEMVTEVSKLSAQLRLEQEKVKNLNEEKNHMLEDMEEMKAERERNRKFSAKLEDMMEERDDKLRVVEHELDVERLRRIETERKLQKLMEAQVALQQSILEDEIPPKTDVSLQPLLQNYSH